MQRIETEHNGYAIAYSENEDVWRCHDLDLDAPKLSTLKTKMNKALAEMRKADIAVLVIGHRYSIECVPAKLVMFDPGGETAWVMKEDYMCGSFSSSPRKEIVRRKEALKSLALDTPENRTAVDQIRAEYGDIQAREKALRERLAAIPRVEAPSEEAV